MSCAINLLSLSLLDLYATTKATKTTSKEVRSKGKCEKLNKVSL